MDVATVDHVLTTTRVVRRRLDLSRPVARDVIERCVAVAFQAPTGSNAQGWHFVVVTDAAKRAALADLYRRAAAIVAAMYGDNPYPPGDLRARQFPRMRASGEHFRVHLHEVPVMVVPCVEGRVENAGVLLQATIYGSILPAVWSFMLALRARGVGSAWTSLHIMFEREVAEILGIPPTVTQAALLPVAYYTGTEFKPAKRLPARDLTHWNGWGKRK
jgi:nitroreductase